MLHLLSLLACIGVEAPDAPPVVPGAPMAGAAEAFLTGAKTSRELVEPGPAGW